MVSGHDSASRSLYGINRRRLSLLSPELENRARQLFYGALGDVVSIGWQPRFLFLLSHMRAGSSLFTRLLCGTKGVQGYGELHLPYRGPRAFKAMMGKIAWVTRTPRPASSYAMDKLLHDYLLRPSDLSVLEGEDTRVIFLLREAMPTLQSLVRSFGLPQERACDYYVGRLQTLAEYASLLGSRQRSIALTYRDVIDRTPQAFRLIEDYLGLAESLQETYGVSDRARGVDPSPNLHAGRVLRDDKVVSHATTIESSFVARAQAAFDRCRDVVFARCRTLEASPPTE